MQPRRRHFSWSLALVVIICVLESLTKGWGSFMLVPISIFALPLFVMFQLEAKKHFDSSFLGIMIRLTSYALTTATLFTYIFLAGGGDTKDILAFGFYKTTTHNSIVMMLDRAATNSFWVVMPALSAILMILLRIKIWDKNPERK
jgi:hypothetical protein